MKKHAVRFTVDFINQKIIGTKASFDKASKGFGPIYEELADMKCAFNITLKEGTRRNWHTK